MAVTDYPTPQTFPKYCFPILGNVPFCPLIVIPTTFFIALALLLVYKFFSPSSVSTPHPVLPTNTVDLEKAELLRDIAASAYTPTVSRRRFSQPYSDMSPEDREEHTRVKSRLVKFRFPPPQGPPPSGPLPNLPPCSEASSAVPRSLDELLNEPASPDSPTLPPGLFADDGSALSFPAPAYLDYSISHLDLTIRNKRSMDVV
ncbi:unnamed protein product [Somion occarium]|uniref:Uncharacterized protein n=1 Tax=Somion occarium TaxID=3059160 RepID=A0ABP1DX32_9APHY